MDDPFEPFGSSKKMQQPSASQVLDPFAITTPPATKKSAPEISNSGSNNNLILTSEESIGFNYIFKVLDADKSGIIGMTSAATFLSRSKLPQSVLREIWDLSDVEKKGSLDKNGLFRALKLVAVAQSGKPVTASALNQNTSLPTFEGVNLDFSNPIKPIVPQSTGGSFTSTTASLRRVSSVRANPNGSTTFSEAIAVSQEEKDRFKLAFQQCSPTNGFADGTKARTLFLRSNLSAEILAQTWTLVDTQATGKLNQIQFCVAMYIISKIKNGRWSTPPSVVPESLWKVFDESVAAKAAPQETLSLLDMTPLSPIAEDVSFPPLSEAEKVQAYQYFDALDKEKKGVISGQESYEFFLKSTLPQNILAGIWNMADKSKTGKLNKDQFAFAIHLVKLKKSGRVLPFETASAPSPVLSNRQSIPPPPLATTTTSSVMETMADLLSLDAPSPSIPASIPPPTLFSTYSIAPLSKDVPTAAIPFRDIHSMEQVDLLEKDKELSKKKSELIDLQNQLKMLQPASDDLKQRRETVESELRSVSDQKNHATLKYSQLRATFEAETHIVRDLEESLIREKQFSEVARAELQQAEKTFQHLSLEKSKMTEQIEKFKNDTADIQAQLAGYRESTSQLQKQVYKLKSEFEEQQKLNTIHQTNLQQAQQEYQQTRKDIQSLEHSVATEKQKNDSLAKQIAVQSTINAKSKVNNTSPLQGISSMTSAAPASNAGSSPGSVLLDALTNDPDPFEISRPKSVNSLASKTSFTSTTNINQSPRMGDGILDVYCNPLSQSPVPAPNLNVSMNSILSRDHNVVAPSTTASKTPYSSTNNRPDSPSKLSESFSSSPQKNSFEDNFPSLETLSLTGTNSTSLFETKNKQGTSANSFTLPKTAGTPNGKPDLSGSATIGTSTGASPPPLPSSSTKPAPSTSMSFMSNLKNIDFEAEMNGNLLETPKTTEASQSFGGKSNFPVSSFDPSSFDFDASFSSINTTKPQTKSTGVSNMNSNPTKFSKPEITASIGNPFSSSNQLVGLSKDDPFALPFPSADNNNKFGSSTFPAAAANSNNKKTVTPAALSGQTPFGSNSNLSHSTPLTFGQVFGAAPISITPADSSTSNNSPSSVPQLQQQPTPASNTSSPPKKPELVKDESEASALKQLMSMGFTREKSQEALKKFNNDIERATDFLLE